MTEGATRCWVNVQPPDACGLDHAQRILHTVNRDGRCPRGERMRLQRLKYWGPSFRRGPRLALGDDFRSICTVVGKTLLALNVGCNLVRLRAAEVTPCSLKSFNEHSNRVLTLDCSGHATLEMTVGWVLHFLGGHRGLQDRNGPLLHFAANFFWKI